MKRYPDIVTAAKEGETPYYTNSSHLPVGFTDDVFEALAIQDDLQTLYTSGTVFHAFVGEKLPGWKAAATLVRKIAENYTLPYYTLSPTYSVCKNHGYINGEKYVCDQCGEATEVYSRITGYYRPVQNWNEGKTQEFKDRKLYNLGDEHFLQKTVSEDSGSFRGTDTELKSSSTAPDKLLLFTTKTCPNCKTAKIFLAQAHVPYEVVEVEDNADMAMQYGIRSAPTLVVKDGSEYTLYVNASNIRSFAESF